MVQTNDAPQFAVGIDLGTTHCALSYARLDHPRVRLMEIPQLVAPGDFKKTLPVAWLLVLAGLCLAIARGFVAF